MIFALMQLLTPYQLVVTYVRAPEELKNQDLDALVKKYRLNDPFYLRYGRWLRNLAHGNLGWSESTGMPVARAIAARFPATLELMLFTALPALLGGILLGSFSAVHHNSLYDHAARLFAIMSSSLPDFVSALVILMIFYGALGWLPPGRLSTWAQQIIASSSFARYTGMNTVDAILNWNWPIFWDAIRHLIAPAMTLAYLWLGFIMRIVRSSMLEVLHKDYVITARAKGLPESKVIGRHVRRNALVPVVTAAGIMVIGLLGGVVIVESIFDYEGIGLLIATAARQLDYPTVLGTTVFSGILLVLVNLAVDMFYAFIDPRIRLG